MRIGLISDTHSHLDPKVFKHFADCDEVWHAGDVGDYAVVEAIENFKPLRAVYGNIDGSKVRAKFPEDLWFDVDGLSVWITHIGGYPPRYNGRVKKILKAKTPPDLMICGHSHILKIMKDPALNNMLYINPGAAGIHGFHQIKTLVKFDVTKGKIENLKVIELGKRGQLDQ